MQELNYKIPNKLHNANKPLLHELCMVNLAAAHSQHIDFELWPEILDQFGLINAISYQLNLAQNLEKRCFQLNCNSKSINLNTTDALTVFRTFQIVLDCLLQQTSTQATQLTISLEHNPGKITIRIADRQHNNILPQSHLIQLKRFIAVTDCHIKTEQQALLLAFNTINPITAAEAI